MRVVREPDELEIVEPSLVDQFLEGAIELDVDLLCDGEHAWIAGILEHIEPAGVHSGDSACVIPGPSITPELRAEVQQLADALAPGLGARGLVNLQLALKDRDLYVIEANPRASRTVPFIAKATGVQLVHHACRLMLGASLEELELPEQAEPSRAWAKEAVFPDDRFPGAADRSPEMKSTGEVMGGGVSASAAYARAVRAAGRGKARAAIGPSLQALAAQPAVPVEVPFPSEPARA